MSLLQVDNLRVAFHTRKGIVRAVNDASFHVEKGETLGIVGESGSGKSVTCYSLMGLIPQPPGRIESGTAMFDGTDLLHCSKRELSAIRGKRIAMIFQDPMTSLNPYMRIGEQIIEPLMIHGGVSRADAVQRALAAMKEVGIQDGASRLAAYPHQFSGGMRQRASIALALALNPALVIADEPVTALDVIVQRQVLDVLRDLQSRLSLSMILVTHDMSVVAYTCDRVAVMYAGQVVEAGTVRAVLEQPLHPYSMGLTHAFPDLAGSEAALVPIEGSPPSLLNPPPGCRFAARCPFAEARCHEQAPPLVETDGHAVACWRADEAADLRALAEQPAVWAALAA